MTREGIIRGSSKQRDEEAILHRKILESPNFRDPSQLVLNANALPTNTNPKVDHAASTNFSAFELPQLIIKKSILKTVSRLQAQLVHADKEEQGVICTHSYLSVHQFQNGDGWLRSACLSFRSSVSAYFLVLTSRLAFDRGEALSGHLLDVPIPQPGSLPLLEHLTLSDVDAIVEHAFGLKEPERATISDLLEFGYREGTRRGSERPGRAVTVRSDSNEQDDVYQYADFFLKTLRATFGKERAVRATVFEEAQRNARLPLRMLAVHLDWPQRRRLITKDRMETSQLRSELTDFYEQHFGLRNRQGEPIASGLGFKRVAHLFITHQSEDGVKVPTVLYVKPDQRRYWTRSQALRDADELAASIMASGG